MNIQPDNVCLVLTATIVPNTNIVSVTDITERRNQYFQALRYYRTHFNGTIYFLENSTYDFENDKEFLEIFDSHTQLIKFDILDKLNRGKGFLEFKMLDEFFQQQTPAEQYFFKITGRYLVKNLHRLIPSKYVKTVADAHKKMKVTLTGVFFCSIEEYLKNISGLYQQVNDAQGVFIEHVIYKQLTIHGKTKLFSVNPGIEGISGSYGKSLKRHPVKMKIRQLERKILNTLNINQFLLEY